MQVDMRAVVLGVVQSQSLFCMPQGRDGFAQPRQAAAQGIVRRDQLNRVSGLFRDVEHLNPQLPARLEFRSPNIEPTQAKKHGKQLGGVTQLLTQFPGPSKGSPGLRRPIAFGHREQRP